MSFLKNKTFIALSIFLLGLFALESIAGPKFELQLTPVLKSLDASRQIVAELGGDPNDKPLVLFVTEWCPYCRKLESFLKSKNIPYVKADVEENKKAAAIFALLSKGYGPGVPKTLVGTYLVPGYQPDTIMVFYRNIQKSGEYLGTSAKTSDDRVVRGFGSQR